MFNLTNIMEAVDAYAETYAETNDVNTITEMRYKVIHELSKVYIELERHKKEIEKIISGE